MAEIQLVRPFSVPVTEAKARVQKTADELAAEYHLKSEWQGNTLHFDRTGLHGQIEVSGREIRLDVHLSLLLRPLKTKLVSRIENKFERLFPEAPRKRGGTKEA
jgi:putative polyhydroxyalkanoate system protein